MPTRLLQWMAVVFVAVALVVGPTSLSAQEGAAPLTPERAAERAALFEDLLGATSLSEAAVAEGAIWEFWMTAPSEEIGRLMDAAIDARRWFALAKSREILDGVTELAPDYPEGWNQRAFTLFLQEDYEGSLADIQRTLELEPKHFGALAGKVQIMMRQGRLEGAAKVMREIREIHPWMPPPAGLPPLPKDAIETDDI